MSVFKIQDIYIYPVKSLGGFRVQQAILENRGFQYDRRWMLVDENNRFLSQRELPHLALFVVSLKDSFFKITFRSNPNSEFDLPFVVDQGENIIVSVWEDSCAAIEYINGSQWFSKQLDINCKLVYMPDSSIRFVEKEYAHNNEIVSFSDEYPLLLIGQGSLDDLNKKLKIPIGMERFRPNIVVATDNPFEEDEWKQIRINSIEVIMAKPCARCAVPSINQVTAAKEKEPGATLAQFRMRDNKIYFGQNLLPKMNGQISCGDLLEIIK